MLTQNEILKFLLTNKERFSNLYNIKKIGLFGSYARNQQTEKSDIDIIIEMSEDTEDIFFKRLELKENIKQHFDKEVDICHLNAIKPMFKQLILKDIIYV